MAAPAKNGDPLHEGSAIDEARGKRTSPACVHERIGAELARQQPWEIVQQGPDGETSAVASMQVEGHLPTGGAHRQRRAIRAEANQREVTGKIAQPLRGAVAQLAQSLQPIRPATGVEAVASLHEGEATRADALRIRLRAGKRSAGGDPARRGPPDEVEFRARGQLLL
jgi:hypothetical protein